MSLRPVRDCVLEPSAHWHLLESVRVALIQDLDRLFPGHIYHRDPYDDSLSSTEAAVISLRRSFYKKLLPVFPSDELDGRSLLKFLEVNRRLETVNWDGPSSEVDSLLVSYTRANFQESIEKGLSSIGGHLASFVVSKLRIGPGASLGVPSDCFYSKLFGGDLTYTDDYLVYLYKVAVSRSLFWQDAENTRLRQGFGFRRVNGNRLFFVAKNDEISRTCCTEPLLNMLVQQALFDFLSICLQLSFGINLSTQPDINRRLTILGSINGVFSTSDLSSASDSVLKRIALEWTPSQLAGLIRVSRSPVTTLPSGKELALNMVSTMGNGFTFPLQTLLFASAVKAVYQLKGLTLDCVEPNFGVFGDDIIVRTECTASLHRILRILGFEVNVDKSFTDGPFRESCGVDAFKGVDIRGVYIRTLQTPHDRYSAFNRLARWSARFGFLSQTLDVLGSACGSHRVPYSESDSSGIKVPESCLSSNKRDQFGRRGYKHLAFKPRRIPTPESAQEAEQLTPELPFNGSGWMLSFLGSYSGTPIASRDGRSFAGVRPFVGENRWYQRVSFIPYWDFAGLVPDKDFHGWKTVMALFCSAER